ncbi:MAG: MFS transporter [Sphingopyxis sp.]|nr:MFS transporter [Sphingopyxis sp.]
MTVEAATAAPFDAADPGVPLATRFFYGMGAIAYGIKDNGFSVFLLLYYNQIIGLDAGLVGLMLLLALLLDALIDPAVGHLSDRTRTRWGRRHPWLYASALPIFLGWLALWMPPDVGQELQLLWLLVFATLVRMSLSLNEVPSLALAPEMTQDYHERTSIIALRFFFGWFGGLAMLAAAYGLFQLADPEFATVQSFRDYAVAGALVMLGAVLVSAIGTHRRFARPMHAGMHQPSLRDMLTCLRFKPFQILLLAVFFAFANQGVTFALSNYLLAYVWKFGWQEQLLYALALFFAVALALVIARPMGERYGKRGAAVRLAIATNVIAVIPYALLVVGLFPESGTTASLAAYLPFVALSTTAGVGVMVTAASMMADVTTAHYEITGKQQEGVFFSGHFFMQKCVTGIGIFLSGQILVLVGFPARANPATIDADVVTRLALVYAAVTLVLGLDTAWALSRYPLRDDARSF